MAYRLCALPIFTVLAVQPASAELGDTDFSAILVTENAFGIDESGPQRQEWRLEPRLQTDLGMLGEFVGIARFEVDFNDRLEPGRPEQLNRNPINRRLFFGDRSSVQLREAYIQGSAGALDYTLGKQQTVWGEADGIKVLDVVNPQTFRAFILDDFDVSRIPLWTVKLQTRISGVEIETVWIPDTTYDEIPEPDALYAITAEGLAPPPLPLDRPVLLADPDRPDQSFADSDVGIRFSTFVGGWDLSFLYLYHFEDRPFFDVDVAADLTTITQRYNRVHLGGMTASRAFGSFVVRSEIGFTDDRAFVVALPPEGAGDGNGTAFSDNLSYVIGVDYFGLPKGLISTQFFQEIAFDEPQGLIRSRVESLLTTTWRGSFLNQRLLPQVQWLTSLNDGDGLVRLSLDYELNDTLTLTAGADLFYGGASDTFGQFNGTDRILLGFKLGL